MPSKRRNRAGASSAKSFRMRSKGLLMPVSPDGTYA